MASVARDLGEDLTAEPLVELNFLVTYRLFQFNDKCVILCPIHVVTVTLISK